MDLPPSRSTSGVTVAIVLVLIILVIGALPISTSAQDQSGTSYAVRQTENGEVTGCATIQPVGNGTVPIGEFYGYSGSPDFSAVGSQSYQYSDVSSLFLYRSADGLALVIINDRYADGTPGGDASMLVDGLPADAEIAVADEPEDASESSDNIELVESDRNGSTRAAQFEWVWGANETDGAAITGLSESDFGTITIEPGFDSSGNSTNVRAWGLRGANSDQPLSLNMSQTTTIERGSCNQQSAGASSATGTSTATQTAAPGVTQTDTAASSSDTTLEVTSLEVDDSTPGVDQQVNFTATVQNTGDSQVTGTIVFRTSENSTEEREISLSPGSTQTLRFAHSYDEQGTYTIRAGQASVEVIVGESTSTSGPGFGLVGGLLAIILGSILATRIGDAGEYLSESAEQQSAESESDTDEE